MHLLLSLGSPPDKNRISADRLRKSANTRVGLTSVSILQNNEEIVLKRVNCIKKGLSVLILW